MRTLQAPSGSPIGGRVARKGRTIRPAGLCLAATLLAAMAPATQAQQGRGYRQPSPAAWRAERHRQMMAAFQANQARNMALVNRDPIYRPMPNASTPLHPAPLPNPASAGLSASYYGTRAVRELGSGNFSAGARDGANALYNAHQAAAGYSAGTPTHRTDRILHAGPAGHSRLRRLPEHLLVRPQRGRRVHAPGVIPDDPWDTPGVIARFSHDIDLPRPRAPARGRSPRRRAAPVTYRVMRGLDLARFLTDDVQLALDRAPRAA